MMLLRATETAAFTASAGSLSAAAVSFTITDDDEAGVTVSSRTVTVDEQATEKYTVVLTSQPAGDVAVTATSGTPDNAKVSAAVTFTSTDWDTAQSFTVTGVEEGHLDCHPRGVWLRHGHYRRFCDGDCEHATTSSVDA